MTKNPAGFATEHGNRITWHRMLQCVLFIILSIFFKKMLKQLPVLMTKYLILKNTLTFKKRELIRLLIKTGTAFL